MDFVGEYGTRRRRPSVTAPNVGGIGDDIRMSRSHGIPALQTPAEAMSDRLRGGRLEVPTVEYSRLGKRVKIVGIKHVASHRFWVDLSAELATQHGDWTVHYERPMFLNLKSSWTHKFKKRIYLSWSHRQARMLAASGYANQFDVLVIPPAWENHDIDGERALSAFNLPVLLLIIPWVYLATLNNRVASFAGHAFVRGLHSDAGQRGSVEFLMKTSILVRERNKLAVDAAIAAEGDVVMIWGHAHIAGMAQLLELQGFLPLEVSWRPLFV